MSWTGHSKLNIHCHSYIFIYSVVYVLNCYEIKTRQNSGNRTIWTECETRLDYLIDEKDEDEINGDCS